MIFFGSKKNKNVNIQDVKLLYAKGNYKSALSSCKTYLEEHKNDFDATNLLGDIYYKMGDKTKSLEIFKQLATSMEEDKYLDRAIAVTKKIIRLFPDQYDMYRKLSKLFQKKNIKAEQLDTLYELADIYEKKGLDEKAIDILKEIAELDRNSTSNYKRIIQKLFDFGKKYDVCKFMHYCIELAHNNKDRESLDYFCNIAIECECDFKTFFAYTIDFFKRNNDKADIFLKYAEEFLLENFDNDIFRYCLEVKPLEKNIEFYQAIKNKHKNYETYRCILDYFVHTNIDDFKIEINEIINLPDFDFKPELSKIAEDYYEKINNPELLDMLVLLASKGSLKDVQLKIYEKLVQLYKELGDIDKATNIEKFINELEFTEKRFDDNTNQYSDIDFRDSENILNLDDTSDFGDIDLELTSFDTDSTGESNFDLELDLDLDTTDAEVSKDDNEQEVDDAGIEQSAEGIDSFKGDVETDDIDIEISLDDFATEEIKQNDSSSIDDFGDIDLTNNNIFQDDFEENISEQIEHINTLINNKKLEEAKTEVDQLIILYPDNEKVKDLAARLIMMEGEDSASKTEEKVNYSEVITEEIRSIAESIRKSINEQVSEDDYETHYDLAIAYMEMELFEDAVSELKKSATGAKKYESLFLLAECYKRMGLIDDAINIHKLIIVDYEEREKMLNSLYEIGVLLELRNDQVGANNYFEKVFKLDPDFRDVKEKYKEIVQENIDTKEGEGRKKKKKISFL
ncbi:MAG: Tetratricopeptide 2 repeat-containing protein [Deferribacteraceae bacterium]|jgi:tetratricopeptide (TPR) repeat protein|nr:Tetratricopeptide 2 repeat-containing protein [Deferribacteraceae bacterium]